MSDTASDERDIDRVILIGHTANSLLRLISDDMPFLVSFPWLNKTLNVVCAPLDSSLISSLSYHNARFMRQLFPSISRLAMSSTNRVVENAMESLTALIRAIPARAKAHQIKIFELTARVCIRHRPPKERKAGDDTERPEVAKSRSENERIRKLAVGVLAVLRETVGEKDFNADIIIQAQKRIPELAGIFSDLGSENAEQGK
mmetsp:Transcript_38251/g.61369  ORF Transcript_38251/g.61369 Transcript_38251/m.61369 type:complete len:202 (+) Transcript_38251:1165-1770(+)